MEERQPWGEAEVARDRLGGKAWPLSRVQGSFRRSKRMVYNVHVPTQMQKCTPPPPRQNDREHVFGESATHVWGA